MKNEGVPQSTETTSESVPNKSFPVSFAQRRFWFLNRLMKSDGYTIHRAVRLRGPLNIASLERAFTEIHRRHHILRTTIDLVDDNLQQIIHPARPVSIPLEDLSLVDPTKRDETIAQLALMESAMPFDLARGPLLRTKLLQVDETEHILLISLHHIVCDGWSISILLAELARLYKAFIHGAPSPLPNLQIQYADFALWQRSEMQGPRGLSQTAYWRRKLRGMPPSLALPTDRPRSVQRQMRGAMESINLDKPLRDGLYALARYHSATLFMVLLSALALVLFRYSGQDDFAIGSPIANRRRRETEQLIGAFINTLIFRVTILPKMSIRDLVEQVRVTALEAYDNQDLPFEEIVEELRPDRDLNEQPVLQVLLALRNEPIETIELPNLDVSFLPSVRFSTPLDLNFSIHEQGDVLSCWMLYDADLFDQATIRRLLDAFRNAIDQMIEDPTQEVGKVNLVSESERELLSRWNATAVPRTESFIQHLVQQRAQENPDAPAVIFEDTILSYHELNSRSNQLAHWLGSAGVKSDVLVGVCMERSFEMVVALLGILKAGGAYVPFDPSYPEQRLQFMADDARVSVILTQERLEGRFLFQGARIVSVDSDWAEIARESTQELEVDLAGENLAYMIYTSGSTGAPRGAMNTHRGIYNRLIWMQEEYGLQRSDKVLQKTPFSFDVSVWEFFWPLMVGATLVVAKPDGHRDVRYLVDLVRNQEITTIHFVPSLLHAFLGDDTSQACVSLRRVICSGEALSPELRQDFFRTLQCELHNLYGPTEAAVDVTCWACRSDDEMPYVPIGRPISNTQVFVLDSSMTIAPLGVQGELYLGGDGLARGYWGRPDLTAAKFVPSPFSQHTGARLYRTGDLARWHEGGYLEYLGRTDFQVKLRGYRIELGEIESALLRHPEVKDALVAVREDHPGDKRLVGYVVRKDNSRDLDTAALGSHLQHALPAFMVPSSFVVLDTLPLAPNGKLDRRSLPPPRTPNAVAGSKPERDGEREIATVWRELLHLDSIGLDDNLFDLGANSLDTIRIQAGLKRRLNHEFELIELFRYPTVRSLASHYETRNGQPATPSKPSRREALETGQDRLRRQRSRHNAVV